MPYISHTDAMTNATVTLTLGRGDALVYVRKKG
jgi:hypothetical protein